MLCAHRGVAAKTAIAWAACAGALLLASCGKQDAAPAARPPTNVTGFPVTARDVPITSEYVAQTQSSQAVNIQARVAGFLDKRVYTEGAVVKAGQVLFVMDRKPFQAQLDAAQAALDGNQAALVVAERNLARTKPLAQQNALSQKDLDDATGQFQQTAAAVAQARARAEEAKLNLSYTTITSPVAGVSSFATVADGTYVAPPNAQLTTVSVLSPMWVNFSISENQMARILSQQKSGSLKLPAANAFDAQVEMADGTLFPYHGKITFADPSYNTQTGTFLIRVSVPNPQGLLRPNQYVRVRLLGASRPSAIMIPQRAVQQSAKGHFVWVADKDDHAQMRPVEVGEWNGDDWFISQGLDSGDVVIVDGTLRLAPGAPVKVAPYVEPPLRVNAAVRPPVAGGDTGVSALVAAPIRASGPASSGTAAINGMVNTPAATGTQPATTLRFATSSATLDGSATAAIAGVVATLTDGKARVAITGYADRTGSHDANVALAKARALTVRDALVAAGLAPDRIQLREPLDVIGSGPDDEARRVDLTIIG